MTRRGGESFTVVSFHAHPDDEALLTSGTLARAVAEGHRVVLVVATNGEAGLAGDAPGGLLAQRRLQELQASARAIGVHRVETLGYADSGSGGASPGEGGALSAIGFAQLDPLVIADQMAKILLSENADVLTIYDSAGGYGHPDHVQVHRVGLLAAQIAGTPVVLEATLDRTTLVRAVAALRVVSALLPVPRLPNMEAAFTARAAITHEVDVRAYLPEKRASLAAHASQTEGGPRTVKLLLALPRWAQRVALGREYFREVGRAPAAVRSHDIFATLRSEQDVPTPP